MGPLISDIHARKVRGYIDKGVEEGAKLLVDGRNFRLQGYENGYFVGGTLFDRVTTDMTIYREEIFGPVLSVALRRRLQPGPRRLSQLRRLEALALRRPSHLRAGRGEVLHPPQDRHPALADRHPRRCAVQLSDDGMSGHGRSDAAAHAARV